MIKEENQTRLAGQAGQPKNRQQAELYTKNLLARLGTEDAPPEISRYFPWATLADVPTEQFGKVMARLTTEAKYRVALGDARYFAHKTFGDYITLYLRAILAMPEILAAAGRNVDDGATIAEMRQMLNRAMVTCDLTAPPPVLLPEAPPESKPTAKPKRRPAKKKKAAAPRRGPFKKPSLEDVTAYAKENHMDMNPEEFWNHYEAQGWLLGSGLPMQVWKSAARSWAAKTGTWDTQRGNVRVAGATVAPKNDRMAQVGAYVPMKDRKAAGNG